MKKINFLKITMALVAIFFIASCANKTQDTTSKETTATVTTESKPGLKIAYVDIDSLLNNYNFSVTLRNEMLRKGENMRMTLSEKAKVIQADMEDFQRKMENNVYATRQRAEEEQSRIIKSQEDYARLEQRLVNELSAEEQKNNITLRDSINSFLKDYNATQGYDLILSRMADNILLANEALDITKEVIDGLNSRYAGSNK